MTQSKRTKPDSKVVEYDMYADVWAVLSKEKAILETIDPGSLLIGQHYKRVRKGFVFKHLSITSEKRIAGSGLFGVITGETVVAMYDLSEPSLIPYYVTEKQAILLKARKELIDRLDEETHKREVLESVEVSENSYEDFSKEIKKTFHGAKVVDHETLLSNQEYIRSLKP